MANGKRKRSRVARKKHRNKPNPKDAIIQLASRELEEAHLSRLFREIKGTRSDRAAGILIATYLEDTLQSAISRAMRLSEGAQRSLFGLNAPLGTFAAKIKIARALHIFGSQTSENLENIRLIRNVFAHAKMSVRFRTKEIKDICDLLVLPDSISSFEQPILKMDTPRNRFTNVCFRTAANFMWFAVEDSRQISPAMVEFSYDERKHNLILRRKPLP
jgi:hypothetical protein